MAENVLNRSELATNYPTTAARIADRDVIDGAVECFTRALSLAEVVDRCEQGDVPCGAVNTIEDIFNDPQFEARGMLARVFHDTLGEVVIPDVLPRLSETPGEIFSLGPKLGHDNTDVLDNLINDENEIRRK
jgi:crotonobetainyl-CoA:carnitine CoA-transferase CaiB-like acyl-CoA transferase